MTRNLLFHTVWIAALGCVASGDTFTHRTDGKSFHGYATQKTNREQTMVFNSDTNKLETATLAEYDIVYNKEGRKNLVTVIPIQAPEILISEAVAKEVADQLVMASNNGPRMIILDIDNPGGNGEYMKIVSSVITGSFNCPVVAYISGEKYGGAYSAAALLALSCKKIYMAPNATLGGGLSNRGPLRRPALGPESASVVQPPNPGGLPKLRRLSGPPGRTKRDSGYGPGRSCG
jgi:hypothetical protein